MDVKKVALLIGALVIAVITAVMAKNMFAGAGAQQAAAATVPMGPKVLVAKKPLPAGTIIDPESFALQPWPKELMQSAYYVDNQPDGDDATVLCVHTDDPGEQALHLCIADGFDERHSGGREVERILSRGQGRGHESGYT